MTATQAPTNTIWATAVHRCHRRGIILWKLTFENVTSSVANTLKGNSTSNTSLSQSPALSSAGIVAKTP